ncbi:MAG: SPOR domain-containing protein, partial [Nitrospiria bacterium]
MHDFKILREKGKKSNQKKMLSLPLIGFMGLLVFLALFFLFGRKEENTGQEERAADVSSQATVSKEEEAERETSGSTVNPGKVRIDESEEPSPSPSPSRPDGGKVPSIPKEELTFLETLKGGKESNIALKGMKEPRRASTPPSKSAAKKYAVQVASFSKKKGADGLAEKLRKRGFDAYVVSQEIPQKGRWYRVRIGHYSSRAEAKKVADRIRKAEKLDPF